ncbi:MAG: hypothetical protein EZS28_018151 [Streblomastix strix]|uniref:TmcB/TmcC TPR repeats domain-containing protein n=1 Tax=Streblomastix strix TaxID=222440 RepID=A0A5J4VUN1_9EUKA|nr:MAG: hypothetical protein EZS28_018151 [Streblomastix strix]
MLFLKKGQPYINLKSEDWKTHSLPKIKDPDSVEPSVRFLQYKDTHTPEMYNYVDYIYTTAIKRHKQNAYLYFMYANFLCYYKKNFIKANSVYRQARISNPSFILRFVLYCKTKEEGRIGSESGSGDGSGSELSSVTFKTTMAQAIEHHEMSRKALKAFFENMTMPTPVYSLMAEHLNTIVEEESKGRKCYEDLLSNHPQNTSVLRNYAKLLMDIYQDEDTADMLLTRADHIEEDQTSPGGEHGQDHHEHKEKEDDYEQQDTDNIVGQQNDDDTNNMQHNLTLDSITGQSQSKSHHHIKQKKIKKKKKKENR